MGGRAPRLHDSMLRVSKTSSAQFFDRDEKTGRVDYVFLTLPTRRLLIVTVLELVYDRSKIVLVCLYAQITLGRGEAGPARRCSAGSGRPARLVRA